MNDGFHPTDAAAAARQSSVEPRRFLPRSPTEVIEPQAAPPPPPRMKFRHRPFVTWGSNFFTVLLVLIAIAGAGAFFVVRELSKPGPLETDKILVVKGGLWDIADQLEQEGVITSPYAFIFAALTQAKFDLKRLRAGEYLFRENVSIPQVVQTLIDGKPLRHSITIPEGLTSDQIVGRLMESDLLAGDIREVPPEGTLMPNTYSFERGWPRAKLLEQMREEQRKIVTDVWAKKVVESPSIKTPRDLVTLASIVEKETGRADERSRVAAVFINRLNLKPPMRLQSDPTIVYGLVGGKGTLGRGITRAEIERATAYNTYVIPGLPPSPIANPGRAALEAVANPSRTRELFFVADGTGGHVFAETIDQHNRNVERWRQIERARVGAEGQKPVDRFEDDGAPAAAPTTPARGQPQRRGEMEAPRPSMAPPPLPGSFTPPTTAGAQPLNPLPSAAFEQRRGPRITDASEGTAKDPLLNRTYGLDHPKTVPTNLGP
ncbi:MAG: endolytic transglycosylase MltG [Beijerinckiaceae bacterium]